jgi:hypothetical protein
MDLIMSQLAYLAGFLKAYWWALLLLAFGLYLAFRFWNKAEEYAAGRWAGVVHLVLTLIFFVILAGLLLAAFWFAGWYTLSLLKTANNTMIDIKSEFGDLPPLGTPMPGGGIPVQTLVLTPGQPVQTPVPGGSTAVPTSPGAACEPIPPGEYTITYDPSATLRDGPTGKSQFVVEIPKGEKVRVLETNCGDGYTERGESRRVKVTWGQYTGWIHAVCIK